MKDRKRHLTGNVSRADMGTGPLLEDENELRCLKGTSGICVARN
jgi:hypothetical protein